MSKQIVGGVLIIGALATAAYLGVRYFARPSQPPTSMSLEKVEVVMDSGSKVLKVPDKDLEAFRMFRGEIVRKNCVEQPEYTDYRGKLGLVVNKKSKFGGDLSKFAKAIDEIRVTQGLPLPLGINPENKQLGDLVYSKCRPICKTGAHLVFVSSVEKNQFVSALTRKGKLKKFDLRDVGLETVTINELNKKGEPFRSWAVPMTDGPWFVMDQYLFYAIDIAGLWLKMDGKGSWKIVLRPPELLELTQAKEPLEYPGCNVEDHCLITRIPGQPTRVFRAPKVCGSFEE